MMARRKKKDPVVWIAVKTKTRRERWARDNIVAQGFECYLPVIEGKDRKLEALFPRYLFVKYTGPWHVLLNTYGVSGLVMTGDRPDVMPDKQIKKLKRLENRDGVIVLPSQVQQRKAEPKPGDHVKIQAGALQGKVGIYEGQDSRDRVRVLMDYLGRKTPVLVARHAVVQVLDQD